MSKFIEWLSIPEFWTTLANTENWQGCSAILHWEIVPAMRRLASEVGGDFALKVEDILFSLAAN